MKHNHLIGIGFKILNCLLFSLISIVIIHCTNKLPVSQVLFFRVFIGAIICFVYLIITKEKISFKLSKKDFIFYTLRALVSFIAMNFWVYAIKTLGVNEATAISYTGPFWIFLSARYVIGEIFSWSSIIAIIANMMGVIIILQPNLEVVTWQSVLSSFASILLWVIYETICKKQTENQHYIVQALYVSIFSSFMILPFAISDWHNVETETMGYLGLLSLLGIMNITSVFLAYSFAPMMVISPFSYTRIVFTTIFTAIISKIMPSINVFLGSAIIISVNFYFAYAQKKEIT